MIRSPAMLGALLLGCAGFGVGEPVTVSDGRPVMGTVLEITLVAANEAEGRETLDELFALAQRLDRLLTVYDPASPLSVFNRAAGQGALEVDPELARVLELSARYGALTGGAFDVTVGPLVGLWTDAAARQRLPSEAELAAARARVGYRHLRVVADGRAELTRPGVAVNLGGIAKGYALDRMLPLLEERGIENALLNFGQSSTWALGRPVDAKSWRLLARGPGESFLGILELRDRALSISGSLGQWVEIAGERYGHVLDPRSGEALRQRRQALILADDATLAEALSKALLVLGPEAGLALVASQPGCEGLLVDADGGSWRSPGWPGS